MKVNEIFHKIAAKISYTVGTPWAFLIAVVVIGVWATTGPIFHFSDTWQLVINTGTTIITFLMVFLIQNTQNRDSKAIHIKLDELLKSIRGARNRLVDIEELPDEVLEELHIEFRKIQEKYTKPDEKAKEQKPHKDKVVEVLKQLSAVIEKPLSEEKK
jgi:low affinity Fe/Cu permease